METSSFSFLNYQDLKMLRRENDSFLLKVELAYKQEKYSRSISSLNKLRNENPELVDQYIFFRSLGHESTENILQTKTNDPLINTCLDYLKFYLNKPSRGEIFQKNFYLYLLLYYFPEMEAVDLAYGFPNDKYGEAFYAYCLYRKAFLIKDIKKYVRIIKQNDKGVRSFMKLEERETLDFIARHPSFKEESFYSFNKYRKSYKDLADLMPDKRKEIISSLKDNDMISIKNGHIELLPGGFFILACY